jgi:ribosomal protein S18 acetylase RimI-like enzyme
MEDVTIRKATPADIPSLYAISVEVHRASYDSLIPDNHRERYLSRYTDTPENRSNYYMAKQNDFDDPHWLCLVAEVSDKVVGFTCALDKEDYILKQGSFIDKDYQGMGIGGKLFAAHLDMLAPGRIVRLYVMENNSRAKKMYEKYGFKTVSKGDRPFFGVTQERMEKKIAY